MALEIIPLPDAPLGALVRGWEPAEPLDVEARSGILDALHRSTRGGGLVIVATHDDRVVARCSRRVELS